MAEDRYVKPSHRQLAKRAREQAIKTEPTVAGMDAEPFQPKVPRVEAAGTADILVCKSVHFYNNYYLSI
jgi:hypothetical protein